jgi:hypothetical protein
MAIIAIDIVLDFVFCEWSLSILIIMRNLFLLRSPITFIP